MTENSKVKKNNAGNVGKIIFRTMAEYGFLSAGIIAAVIGAVAAALIPPLVLGYIVDTLAMGELPPVGMAFLYFGRASHCVRTEDNPRIEKQPYGKACQAVSR